MARHREVYGIATKGCLSAPVMMITRSANDTSYISLSLSIIVRQKSADSNRAHNSSNRITHWCARRCQWVLDSIVYLRSHTRASEILSESKPRYTRITCQLTLRRYLYASGTILTTLLTDPTSRTTSAASTLSLNLQLVIQFPDRCANLR
ncbi:hypothetical protein BC629DRAFT_1000125 [Irpex lacteus]|nr:hypothetical protein BC629DRAFT_1000125 [Irpex lacteus]